MSNYERLIVLVVLLVVVLFGLAAIQYDIRKRRRLYDERRAGRTESRYWASLNDLH